LLEEICRNWIKIRERVRLLRDDFRHFIFTDKEGRRGIGSRSRIILMKFQSMPELDEEEAIREALKRFLAAIIAQ